MHPLIPSIVVIMLIAILTIANVYVGIVALGAIVMFSVIGRIIAGNTKHGHNNHIKHGGSDARECCWMFVGGWVFCPITIIPLLCCSGTALDEVDKNCRCCFNSNKDNTCFPYECSMSMCYCCTTTKSGKMFTNRLRGWCTKAHSQ